MKREKKTTFLFLVAFLIFFGTYAVAAIDILLGRPTDKSITVNVIPDRPGEICFEYGTSSGVYGTQTTIIPWTSSQPVEQVISGLEPDTRYYYRMLFRETSGSPWTIGDEYSFRTQRAPEKTFTFTITSDSHINITAGATVSANLWQQTLNNIAADHPDFHIDLGDTFKMDNVTTVATAESSYLLQRSYFGIISNSVPIFLAVGNHEQQEGWHLDDTADPNLAPPIIGANAQKKYFLNPVPNNFYSGDPNTYPALGGDGLREDYYAWTWGDALFVIIDPYWYTMTKPFTGNTGGGEPELGSGNRWDWTLGIEQFNWFKTTLQNSDAKYKFVFAHHMVGGSSDYVRGGAVPAHMFEWGGYNIDGVTWGLDTERPGWGGTSIHQLMVANGVRAFFHGHDHQYAYEVRDGIVYQEVPMPSNSTYGYGFNLYNESDPYTVKVLPNSGHIRVTVSPSLVTVDYVRAYLPGNGTNGQVSYSYNIPAPYAQNPLPVHGALTNAPSSLRWTPSPIMIDQDVYFGTDPNMVETRDNNCLIADDIDNSDVALPQTLETGVTYYWLVDSNSLAGIYSLGLWSFTVEIPDSNLIGSWQFEEAGYPIVLDSSGYCHDGIFAGQATIVSDPNRGSVLWLDGDGDYVDLGNEAWTNPGNNTTISAWFKVANFNSSYQTVVAKGNTTYRLARYNNTNNMWAVMNDNSTYRSVIGTTNVNNAEWHHIAATYDGTTMKLYIDGQQEGSPVNMSPLNTSVAPLMIGRNSDQISRDWEGWVDDVRLYKKALTAEEILNLMYVDTNFENLQKIADNWLTAGPLGNLNGDDLIDLLDFAAVAQRWLAR